MASKAYQPTSLYSSAPYSPARDPLILIVPESAKAGPDHWQSRWERQRDNCRRLDLGMWDEPHRNTWINKLNLAIYRAERPVLLVAHGLGCLTVAWWAEYERPAPGGSVIGALMIAPPDLDRPSQDARVAKFAACPRQPLPFPAFVVASANDPACSIRSAIQLARDWDCRFAEAGAVGHLDADSGVGNWAMGQQLLGRLLNENRPSSYQAAPLHQAPIERPQRYARGLDS